MCIKRLGKTKKEYHKHLSPKYKYEVLLLHQTVRCDQHATVK